MYPNTGHEDVCRGANRRWIARHNQVTRAFINTLNSQGNLKVEAELVVQPIGSPGGELRADFSVLIGTTTYYYNIQIVALNKDSAREDPYNTLEEAAKAKQ
jgi:hypothetical protein